MFFPTVRSIAVALLAAGGLLFANTARAQNLVRDPGLEVGAPVWTTPYLPAGTENKGCRFSIVNSDVHTGTACGLLESKDFSRFAISPNVRPEAAGGSVYRVSVWVRADKDFQAQPGTPGFTLRLDFLDAGNEVKGRTALDWQGKTLEGDLRNGSYAEVPARWTKVEAKVTAPPGTSRVRLALWFEYAEGHLLFDDLAFERVE